MADGSDEELDEALGHARSILHFVADLLPIGADSERGASDDIDEADGSSPVGK